MNAIKAYAHWDFVETGQPVKLRQAKVPVLVPNDAALQGATFYLQWQVIDPAANTRGFILSDAAEALVY